jgi:hypothetical protein
MKNKGQSEMVGFALILIIVAVLILIFLSFSLKKDNSEFVESYEVESFLQASLEQTTNCSMKYGSNFLSLVKVIRSCIDEEICFNGEDPCQIMNQTVEGILENAWKVGKDWPTKGYSFKVLSKGEKVLILNEGNVTRESKGDIQVLDEGLEISFVVFN